MRLWLQNLFIVAASYLFYGWWSWKFLLLISFTSIWSWVSGLILESSYATPAKRKFTVAAALIVNLGILCVFKYFNFFAENFAALANLLGFSVRPTTLSLILPVGISFYTFQALSYVLDVYRRQIAPTRDLVAFLAFVSFFPQLVAGPIERATNLLPQFLKPRSFEARKAIHGTTLICYGLFKKIVVADSLAMYVDNVWKNIPLYSSATLIIAAVFFSIQIYCDFSGYSDIARGVARWFGFELMVNFDRPYLSRSFGEFWKRWHISLSSWFRDYVYIPLGGNRVAPWRAVANLWIVMLVSGLWHGAAWGFVIWGAIHALYLSIARLIKIRLPKVLDILLVNLSAIFAWIFFRGKNLGESAAYIKQMCCPTIPSTIDQLRGGLGFMFCTAAVLMILALGLSYLTPRDCNFSRVRSHFCFSALCLVLCIVFAASEETAFIYFQF